MSKLKSCLFASLILLTGCASYNASVLSSLPLETGSSSTQNSNVSVSWKTFDRTESKRYLGRDVLSEGYTPIQITIRNNTSDPMYLSYQNFNVPLAAASEVADKVHTSTAGRVVGYGIPGLFVWPFLIPAVYDGIQSSRANDALNADYDSKALKEHTIQPQSTMNGIVFVPKNYTNQTIEMTLVNQKTSEKLLFSQAPR